MEGPRARVWHAGGRLLDSQKFLALGLAIAWPIISVLVFLRRSFYRIEVHHVSGSINAGTGAAKKALTFVSNFDQQPMTRSLILILVLAAFATSTYLQSILEQGATRSRSSTRASRCSSTSWCW